MASYISKYTVFFMLIFAVPIMLETDFLLGFWLGKDVVPPYTTIMCQLILVNLIIDGMGEGLAVLVQATGKIKWFQVVLSGTSLLSLPLGWILYKIGLPPCAIIVCFIITSSINLVWRPLLLKKLVNFDVKKLLDRSYLKIFYVILSTIPLFFIINIFDDGWSRFMIVIPSSIIYTLCVMCMVGTDAQERSKIISYIRILVSTKKWS